MKEVEGRRYGPFEVRTCLERVGDFVAATGDDPDRWQYYAPPSFAAVFLFAAAPAFFSDPDVALDARALIHGDQTFRWLRRFPLERELHVWGSVDRVRSRGEVFFVSFSVWAEDLDGGRHLESSSTFLLGSGLAAEPAAEEPEPEPEAKGADERPIPLADAREIPPLLKSASRADLVRYAAATRDWNPIHWDHAAARSAGLSRVVCHGLLLGSWMAQAAARLSPLPDPLAELRVRFREPLQAGVPARVESVVEGEEPQAWTVGLSLLAEGTERATGRALVRRPPVAH